VNLLAAALCAATLFAMGCEEEAPRLTSNLRSPADLARVHRVALLTLADDAAQPDVAAGMTDALYRALQERQLFHVELLRTGHPAEALLRKGAQGPYTLDEMAEIRSALQCDAVLLGSVTVFQPYPRMQIGLVLRLLDLKNASPVWSVDLVWDTRDKTVQAAIRRYFDARVGRKYEPLDWQYGLMSPDVFERFVAWEVTRTLPDGGAPPRK
jgi:hypothetical protein